MSIIKTSRLRLLTKVITVYFKNLKVQKCMLWQNASFLNCAADGVRSYCRAFDGKPTNCIELTVWAGIA
jgi:hypothetical protein